MHKLILYILILLAGSTSSLYAQTPSATVRPTATPVSLPPVYQAAPANYVRTLTANYPTTDTAAVAAPARTTSEVVTRTEYFDGLGHLIQTVTKGISPNGKDLVAPLVYDAFGRERYSYLPYVPQSGNADGKFKVTPFISQDTFYKSGLLNPGAVGETIYYKEEAYENSPLNRTLKSFGEGNSWASTGGNKPIEKQYSVNTISDSVRIWIMGTTVPTTTAIYGAGQLQENIKIDEDATKTIEYKDKDEHVVLKRVQLSSTAGNGHVGWLNTYYVYDDTGNLRFVIPPLAVQYVMTSSWSVTTIADELCFKYEYDGRNRMTTKKIPGSGVVYMIYDIRDREAFSQDAIQRTKNPQEWLATFYDEQNRPTMTAIYAANTTPAALQTSLNGAATSQTVSYVFPAVADLVLGNYDGSSSYTATNSILFQDGFDSGTAAEFLAEINTATTGGTTTINASSSLPGIAAAALTPLTYTFYDNYDYTGVLSYNTGDLTKPQAGLNPNPETLPATQSNMTNGKITGIKVRVLGTDQWLTTSTYYNNKGRVIQSSSDNHAGGKDIQTNLYDFSGKLLSTYLRHTNPRSGVTPQLTVLTMRSYDAGGRLLNIVKRLNDVSGQDKTILAKNYDELGALKQKRLGVTGTTTQLDSLNYVYNIRGWLQGINKTFVNTASSTASWFGEEVNYDYGFSTKQYNGNIAGAKWKSKSNGIARAYGYSYDQSGRLTAADFSQQNTSAAAWTKDAVNFTVSNLAYDANGNIMTMKQVGLLGTAVGTIDSLTYTYTPGTNKLSAVADPINTATAKLGDFINGTNTGNDYSYDVNGSMITDQNKGITAITYNHLDLPVDITMTGKGTISYQYDAYGTKLKKTVVDNTVSPSKTTVWDYIDDFMYEQDTLQSVAHEEGRIRPVYSAGQPIAFSYDYFEKDHLGNIRLILTDQTDFTMYTATMESAAAATETALFSNVEETRTEKPAGYPDDQTTPKNAFVAKLNAKGNKIGPSLVLRIMAGDTVKINAKAFYKSAGPTDKAKQHPAEDILAGLVQAFGGQTADDSHGAAAINNTPFNSNFYNNDYQHLKEKNPDNVDKNRPKAYLNFVLFDDQFKLVDENSGVRQVKSTADELQELGTDKMVAAKNGFLYVYTSNETEQDVFFDNVVVAVNSGPVLEETHYYPFGLTMAGISSNALKGLNYPENNKKYNGIELQHEEFGDGSGLEWYGADFRSLDPQIGRWLQIDPRPNSSFSPYASMDLNPVNFSDAWGDSTVPVNNLPAAWPNFNPKTDQVQLNAINITAAKPSENTAGISPEQTVPLWLIILDYLRRIPTPVISLPTISPSLVGTPILTVVLVLTPANYGDPSSDHLPQPAFPNAKDLPWEPGVSPGPGWTWQGSGTPESGQGNWVNNDTQQRLHPDLNHPLPRGPHWGLKQPDKSRWDLFPDGRVERNKRD